MTALVSVAQPTMFESGLSGQDYSDRSPEAILQAADRIVVHSGNIASWTKLRRRTALTTTDELVLGTETALKSWMGRERGGEESQPELTVRNRALCQKVEEEERNGFQFTLKVFLSCWDGNMIHTAVQQTLFELGVQRVEAIIVAFPPTLPEQLSVEDMKTVWKYMEQLVRDDLTTTIGVADLFRPHLEELYRWAEIKPMADQLNLAHCCTIPEDLSIFAKENNVRLFTHNDERDILPSARLQEIVGGVWGDNHDNRWGYNWCVRYVSVVRMRGIIAHKGYLVELQNEA